MKMHRTACSRNAFFADIPLEEQNKSEQIKRIGCTGERSQLMRFLLPIYID